MSIFQNPTNLALNQSLQFPVEVVPERMSTLYSAGLQTTSITPINSNTAQQNQNLIWNLPTGMNAPWIVSQTCCLECDIEITKTTATNGFKFKFPSQSAHAIINSLNISCGGQTIDDFPKDYNAWVNSLLCFSINNNYWNTDMGILEKAKIEFVDGNLTETVHVVLPLFSGFLQGIKHVPLPLMNQVQLNIGFASNNTTFFLNTTGVGGAATDTASYTIRNPRLVYQQLDMGSDYNNMLKRGMQNQKFFNIPFISSDILSSVSTASPYQLNNNIKRSNVLSLLTTRVLTADYNDQKVGSECDFVRENATKIYYVTDGTTRPQLPNGIDSSELAYYMLETTTATWTDPAVCSLATTIAEYEDLFYVTGVDLQRSKTSSTNSYSGTPLTNLSTNIEYVHFANVTNFTFIVHTKDCVILPDGSITMSS